MALLTSISYATARITNEVSNLGVLQDVSGRATPQTSAGRYRHRPKVVRTAVIGFAMMDKRFIDELNERIARAMQGSPVADVEKNVRAALAGWFVRMQLVPREDFEVQRRLLERAQAKLAELEKRISDLETRRPAQPPHK